MIAFTVEVEIERPVDDVFAFLADFENMSAWNYAVLRVDKLTQGPVGVGTLFHLTRRTDEQDFAISALDAPRLVQVTSRRSTSPPLMMQFKLEPSAAGTRVRDSWNLDLGGSPLEHVGAYGVRRAVAANLDKLQAAARTRPHGATGRSCLHASARGRARPRKAGTMTAYAIGILTDVQLGPPIVEYLDRIDATLAAHDGHFIVHGSKPAMLEGTSPGDVIVIEFPDRARAQAWYVSEAYQQILPLRTENSVSTVFLLDGVDRSHRATDALGVSHSSDAACHQ